MVVLDKRASKLLEPLAIGGGGTAAALAGDISAGDVLEKFQTQKVSEQSAARPPPPDTHAWVATSQNICLLRTSKPCRAAPLTAARGLRRGWVCTSLSWVGVGGGPLAGRRPAARCLFIYDLLLRWGTAIPTCSPLPLVMHE